RAEIGLARAQRERDLLEPRVGIARAGELAAAVDDDSAVRPGRLDRRLDDDAQELLDIVRRLERLAETHAQVAQAVALSVELDEPLLELRRHVVEHTRELRELVAAAHLDALAETAVRDRIRGLREASERAHDRTAEQ